MTVAIPTQVLSFILGKQTYGVDILRVQEIRGWSTVTRIPHTPAHVLGVLNLRGSVIPVVDLRMRFALPDAQYVDMTVIIVVSVMCAGAYRDFGVVVDGVSDVVDVDRQKVRPSPDLGNAGHDDPIYGLLPVADRLVILLDIDKLVGKEMANSLPEDSLATAETAA
jgi:purine-binding chemotaxis protein CheW